MATVANATQKSNKAFYAHLYDTHGVLTMDAHGALWFRATEDDTLTLVEPEMCPFVMTYGEVGLCETQALADQRHGGYAHIACDRLMEVA